jgi:hypothetical protein
MRCHAERSGNENKVIVPAQSKHPCHLLIGTLKVLIVA